MKIINFQRLKTLYTHSFSQLACTYFHKRNKINILLKVENLIPIQKSVKAMSKAPVPFRLRITNINHKQNCFLLNEMVEAVACFIYAPAIYNSFSASKPHTHRHKHNPYMYKVFSNRCVSCNPLLVPHTCILISSCVR